MDLSDRILRLIKVLAEDKATILNDYWDLGQFFVDQKLSELEKKAGLDREGEKERSKFTRKNDEHHNRYRTEQQNFDQASGTSTAGGVPSQVAEDLHIFDLKPPSSFEEVKKARNREIKKYHPDKFLSDHEKLETAKQILQIYNGAFERLRVFYNGRNG